MVSIVSFTHLVGDWLAVGLSLHHVTSHILAASSGFYTVGGPGSRRIIRNMQALFCLS